MKHDNLGHLVSCFKFFHVVYKVFICIHYCIFCVHDSTCMFFICFVIIIILSLLCYGLS